MRADKGTALHRSSTAVATITRPSIRFRGRSFMALVLAPEPPVADWLSGLDALLERSPGFFADRSVVLDVGALQPDKAGMTALLSDLGERGIRVFGIEGADPSALGLGLPPPISGGRPAGTVEAPHEAAPEPAKPLPSLVLDHPVRSGQCVAFPDGDVTVIGSVASGAEVIAGGSIHIYGALRGRAIAGSMGGSKARIFCRRFEAELLAIDGLYKTADEVGAELWGRPVQARLDGESVVAAALD